MVRDSYKSISKSSLLVGSYEGEYITFVDIFPDHLQQSLMISNTVASKASLYMASCPM